MIIAERVRRTVANALAQAVVTVPDKDFIVTDRKRVTYRQMDVQSDRLALGLARLGIGSGTTLLLLLPNTVDFIALWLALAKLGAVEVPINTAYLGTVLAHIINNSSAETLIIDRQFLDRLAAIAEDLKRLTRLIVYAEDQADVSPFRVPEEVRERFELIPFANLLEGDGQISAPGPGYTDLAAVMYTSGTTGVSKGVMITHAHAYEYSLCVVEVLELRPGDVYYAPLPLFHIAGQWAVVYAALIAEATVVLLGRFSVANFWPDVRRHRVNTTLLLGAMANFLYRQPPAPEDSTSTLEKALVVPLFPEIYDFSRRFNVKVTTNYGSTEVCVPLRAGFELHNPRLFDLHDSRSCGRVVSDRFEVRIVDANDEEVPVGQVGELLVRPKVPWIVMAGYWNNPGGTAEAWRNLWLHSGDAMYRDVDGNFYFVDRLKDAIRRRGENISSVEVENEITRHDAVLECAVIGVASEFTEEEVMAVVVLRPDRALAPAELIAFLEPRLPRFMVPRYVEFLAELPKTPTGKIQKFPLRSRGVTPATWDRESAEGSRESARGRSSAAGCAR